MGINIRQKGQEGEREIARALNSIIGTVLTEAGIPIPPKDIVQRNQNQSAVGGNDLSGTFEISIEVKRQEQLSINTWWNQCVAGAKQSGGIPVLIYRQNKQKWSVVMMVEVRVSDSKVMVTRGEISWDAFLQYFYLYVKVKVQEGWIPPA